MRRPCGTRKGYGSHITVYAREIAESSRKLSMLSPAEPSLIKFMNLLEYRSSCMPSEFLSWHLSMLILNSPHLQTNVLTPQEYNSRGNDFGKPRSYQAVRRSSEIPQLGW